MPEAPQRIRWKELGEAFESAATHCAAVVLFAAAFAISVGALHLLLLGLGVVWSDMSGDFPHNLEMVKAVLTYMELFLILLTFLVISGIFIVQLARMAMRSARE